MPMASAERVRRDAAHPAHQQRNRQPDPQEEELEDHHAQQEQQQRTHRIVPAAPKGRDPGETSPTTTSRSVRSRLVSAASSLLVITCVRLTGLLSRKSAVRSVSSTDTRPDAVVRRLHGQAAAARTGRESCSSRAPLPGRGCPGPSATRSCGGYRARNSFISAAWSAKTGKMEKKNRIRAAIASGPDDHRLEPAAELMPVDVCVHGLRPLFVIVHEDLFERRLFDDQVGDVQSR